ncbi:serine-rich adhesin for platelets, partial [Hyalella azteca]|uniref:Serine-rich adhesin for platelets n=1 Tax=Hyalella azteca TaxID=294128 RepID=A0A8B7NCA9_HYAAZ
ICNETSRGTWTVERDEDLTAPYAFANSTWIAYEDPTSLRIKTKYAMLRGLAGVAVHDVSSDDRQGTCGAGTFPLLGAVWTTYSQLIRTPRKAVLESLVADLEAEGSAAATTYSLAPSAPNARRFSTSPFKIVRIVDRNGDIRALRSNDDTDFECTRQGYYRNPKDCSQFYRCVKFDQYIDDYTVFEYGCPSGLVFDDRWEVCAWPSTAPPCDGSSEIFPVPSLKNLCPGEGFFSDPENCRWFFACKDYYGNGTYLQYEFRCPFGLAYDEANGICNWSWLVNSCGDAGVERQKYSGNTGNIRPISVNQVAGGLFRDRGQGGKELKDKASSYDTESNKPINEKCIDCGDSPLLALGGVGVYDPVRGLVVGHELATKNDGSYDEGFKSVSRARNKIFTSSNSQGSLAEQGSLISSTSSVRESAQAGNIAAKPQRSKSRFTSANDELNSDFYSNSEVKSVARPESGNGGNAVRNLKIQHSTGQRTSSKTYSTQSEPDDSDETDQSDGYSFPQPTFGSSNFGNRLSKVSGISNNFAKDSASGRPTAAFISYGVPTLGYSTPSPQPQHQTTAARPSHPIDDAGNDHSEKDGFKYDGSLNGESSGNEKQSSYSYPEPDVSFDFANAKKNGPNLSTVQQPPQPYGLSSSDRKESNRDHSEEKYDKSMFGHNVQSANRNFGYTEDRNPYSPDMPSSIFVKIDNGDDKTYGGINKNSNEDVNRNSGSEGYAYNLPTKSFDPFTNPDKDGSDGNLAQRNSNSNANLPSPSTPTYSAPRPTIAQSPTASYTSPRSTTIYESPRTSYTSPRPITKYTPTSVVHTTLRPTTRYTPRFSTASPNRPSTSYTSRPASTYDARPENQFPSSTLSLSNIPPRTTQPRPKLQSTTSRPLSNDRPHTKPEYSYGNPVISFNPFQAPTKVKSDSDVTQSLGASGAFRDSGVNGQVFNHPAANNLRVQSSKPIANSQQNEERNSLTYSTSSKTKLGSGSASQAKHEDGYEYSAPSGISFNPFAAPQNSVSRDEKPYYSGSRSDAAQIRKDSNGKFRTNPLKNSNIPDAVSHFGPISEQTAQLVLSSEQKYSANDGSSENIREQSVKKSHSRQQDDVKSAGYAYSSPSKSFNPFKAPEASLNGGRKVSSSKHSTGGNKDVNSSENDKYASHFEIIDLTSAGGFRDHSGSGENDRNNQKTVSHFGSPSRANTKTASSSGSFNAGHEDQKSLFVSQGTTKTSEYEYTAPAFSFDPFTAPATTAGQSGSLTKENGRSVETSRTAAPLHFRVITGDSAEDNEGSSKVHSTGNSVKTAQSGYQYKNPSQTFNPFAAPPSIKIHNAGVGSHVADDSSEDSAYAHFGANQEVSRGSSRDKHQQRPSASLINASADKSNTNGYRYGNPEMPFNPFTAPLSSSQIKTTTSFGKVKPEESQPSVHSHFGGTSTSVSVSTGGDLDKISDPKEQSRGSINFVATNVKSGGSRYFGSSQDSTNFRSKQKLSNAPISGGQSKVDYVDAAASHFNVDSSSKNNDEFKQYTSSASYSNDAPNAGFKPFTRSPTGNSGYGDDNNNDRLTELGHFSVKQSSQSRKPQLERDNSDESFSSGSSRYNGNRGSLDSTSSYQGVSLRRNGKKLVGNSVYSATQSSSANLLASVQKQENTKTDETYSANAGNGAAFGASRFAISGVSKSTGSHSSDSISLSNEKSYFTSTSTEVSLGNRDSKDGSNFFKNDRAFNSPYGVESHRKSPQESDSGRYTASSTAGQSPNVGRSAATDGSHGHFGNLNPKTGTSISTKPNTTPNVPAYGKNFADLQSLGVRVPINDGPPLVAKLGGYSAKNSKKGPQKFGPGGVRDFDDTLGPEVCERAGLFRHPDSCDKFYECYWDRWIEKFTLHVFDCPVTIVYDSGITACNWPFNGPPCADERHA